MASSVSSAATGAGATKGGQVDPHAAAAASFDMDEACFEVHSCSSYSATYHPRNILVDSPKDQSSRWSSGNNQDQYIVLGLNSPAVIKRITFGKYHTHHPCNLREFKVFGGLQTENMMELLCSGLRNDSEPESFKLRHTMNGVVFPVQYIKIVPILAWGNLSEAYNYSIWHVRLHGILQQSFVSKVMQQFQGLQETEAVRLCLKHFRQRNFMDSFEQLQKRTKIDLEDPILTRLFHAVVTKGDFEECERIIQQSANEGMMKEHISSIPYTSEWILLGDVDTSKKLSSDFPGARGGHQMCIDSKNGKIYLFGGWEGKQELSDLWSYDINLKRWNLISSDTSADGGPSARSCHKLSINEELGQVYALGRYVEPRAAREQNLTGDFYRYDIAANTWVLLSANTEAEGGPPLIYDHQMCMNCKDNVIYVLGGSIPGFVANPRNPDEVVHGGLYQYDCASNTWALLRSEKCSFANMSTSLVSTSHKLCKEKSVSDSSCLPCIDTVTLKDEKNYLSDFYKYIIDTKELVEISRDCSKQGGPLPGFTLRSTIDSERDEFYALSGLFQDRPSGQTAGTKSDTLGNCTLWVFNMARKTWYCAFSSTNNLEYLPDSNTHEPCPRYAHQLVYDRVNKIHYLFGGNPNVKNIKDQSAEHIRLGDFWQLQLERPVETTLVKRCKCLLRRQRFTEMCREDPRQALRYLQSDLHAVVDHTDKQESAAFRALSKSLFGKGRLGSADSLGADNHGERMALYETLLEFYPKEMRQPQGNLVDLIAFK